MNILRRLPLSRLLLLCGLVVVIGVSATALALAVGSGPVPKPKPLAQAIHDALSGGDVEGLSANVTLTDHLLEGASLAGSGETGQLSSSPLITGASGRLWIAKDGRARLELQSQAGDTQILYDGRTISIYDASTNTLYRYTVPPAKTQGASSSSQGDGADQTTLGFKPEETSAGHEVPSLAKIEEGIAHLERHETVSGATPTDVAGQAAYTVRVSPREGGSLLGGAELSFDAVHGLPLRAAVYSSSSASPVIELAATEVSYGPVAASVFSFSPPSDAKVKEVAGAEGSSASDHGSGEEHPRTTTLGHGPSAIEVLESPSAEKSSFALPAGVPKVDINGQSAAELPTALGTILSFERSGVRYLLLGSVTPAAIEAVARGL